MAKGQKTPQKRPNIVLRFTGYLRDVRAEMKRVVWPDRDEIASSSMIVIVTLIVFVVFVLLVDWLSSAVIIDGIATLGG